MAEDLDSQLAAMEEKAPLTPERGDPGYVEQPEITIGQEPIRKDDQSQAPQKTQAEIDAEAAKAAQQQQPKEGIEAELEAFKKKFSDQQGLAAKERAERRAEAARREALEQQLAQERQQMAQLQARIRGATQRAPDPDENVVEALKYERALRMQREAQEQQTFQQQQYQQAQLGHINNIKSKVEDFEGEFRLEHPEYDDAANWLVDFEQERLEQLGVPKAQAEQGAINWAINAANIMISQGRNPAQVAWEQANKMGWKPKGAATQGAAAQQDAAAQRVAQETAAAQAKLQQQKAGQAAAKTLGGGSGNTGDDSLQAGLNLKGAAFDSWAEKFLTTNR